MKKSIFGAGGFSRDILSMWESMAPMKYADLHESPTRFVDDEYWKGNNDNILPLSKFDPYKFMMIVSVGDPKLREEIVGRLPKETLFWTFCHSTAILENPKGIIIGEGSVISTYSIIVCNTVLGKHSHLNLNTIIGHDSCAGDYFTTSPGTVIAGDCKIGNRVYFGQNATCKQGLSICDDVTIGMNAAVVKDITEPGIYVGIPARRVVQ